VSFAPGLHNSATTAGAKSANLSVTAAGAATHLVGLSGTTTVATVGFSAPSPSLANKGTTAHSATITLTNNSTSANPGPLTLTAAPTVGVTTAGPTGSSLTVTGGTCVAGLTVAPLGTCTIIVTYNSNSAATSATAHVTVNDTGAAAASQSGANFNAN